jgi:hypothetical protein
METKTIKDGMETYKLFKTSNSRKSKVLKIRYFISDMGNVKKFEDKPDGTIKETFVVPTLSGGHRDKRYLCLSDNKFKYVHRVVATAFIDNPDNLSTVDHIDGNKMNNHVSNLQWCTNLENMQMYYKRIKEEKAKNENNC